MAKRFTFHRFEMKSCGGKVNPVRAQLGTEADVAIGEFAKRRERGREGERAHVQHEPHD